MKNIILSLDETKEFYEMNVNQRVRYMWQLVHGKKLMNYRNTTVYIDEETGERVPISYREMRDEFSNCFWINL